MSRKLTVFKYSPNIISNYKLNKYKLSYIIEKILIEYKKFTAFGYNRETEEFWAKIIKKNDYVLYFTISIEHINETNSKIIIQPLVGDITNIVVLFHNKDSLLQQ